MEQQWSKYKTMGNAEIKNTVRYNNFLNNYKFFNNNIDFRIHSSKSLEKWKNVQAFQLNQLVNGRYYFDPKVREILLLNYELWSKWLYEVENYCIELSGKDEKYKIDDDNITFIILMANKVREKFNDIISKNPEYFDIKFTTIWLEQHKNSIEYIYDKMKYFSGFSVVDLFVSITDLITEVMQHALIELHELENLFRYNENNTFYHNTKRNLPFVIANEFDVKVFLENGLNLVAERIFVYNKFFDIKKIYIKNYSSMPIPYNFADDIEKQGIEIDYKLSSRFDFEENLVLFKSF